MVSVRNAIKRVNSRVDERLAPSRPDRSSIYRSLLADEDFSRALHFGSGRDKNGVADRLNSDKNEIVSIDPDSNGLEQNPSELKVKGDGQRLPFEENSFDLVFSEYVFEHLPKPKLALEEIDRVLQPEGSFVVLVPNPRHYYALVADLTPFWFHKLWFRLQGVESADDDRFPTQYEWGTFSDIHMTQFDWSLEQFYSFPGPTSYTKPLPIHFAFTLLDRSVADYPQFHVAYIARYRKREPVEARQTTEIN